MGIRPRLRRRELGLLVVVAITLTVGWASYVSFRDSRLELADTGILTTYLVALFVIHALFVIQLISMGAMEMSGPFWPVHLKTHSTSALEFGIASVAVYIGPMLGIMLTAALWGRGGDRFGHKLMMVRALLGLSLTQLALAFATDVWMILALRCIQGACAGYIAPAQTYGVSVESPLRRACERAKTAVAIGCYPDGERDLAKLIDDELRVSNLRIAPDARASLMALLGGDRQASRNELKKLALYAHGEREVTLDDVMARHRTKDRSFDAAASAAFAAAPGIPR